MKKSIYLIAAGILSSVFAFAQETSAPKKEEGKFTVNGYIDSYYLTTGNRAASGQLQGIGTGRAFDRLSNQFALGLVQTRFAYTTEKSEMVIDLTFGPNAQLGNFGNAPLGYLPSNSNKGYLYGTGAAIKQAYFTYKFTDKLSFTVGQFGTHIGYEVIDAPVNFHYSLSNLFNNGPFYHIGAKVNYAISDKMGVMAGVVNNWDAMMDWKTQKSVIGQFYVSPIDGLNIYVNAIGGHNDDGFLIYPTKQEPSPNYAPASTPYNRMLLDLTTGYQINEKFYVGLNAAYGMYFYNTKNYDANGDGVTGDNLSFPTGKTGKSASWFGVAIYPNYKINDMFSIGARIEHFNDANGVRYFGYNFTDFGPGSPIVVNSSVNAVNNSVTLTAPITLADGHVIIKPEVRIDMATVKYKSTAAGSKEYTVNYYENKDGLAKYDAVEDKFTGGSPTQTTFGVAFIYKY